MQIRYSKDLLLRKQVSPPQALQLDSPTEGLTTPTDGFARSLATLALFLTTHFFRISYLHHYGQAVQISTLKRLECTETLGKQGRLKSEPAPLAKSPPNGGWTLQISRGRRSSATSRARSSKSTQNRTKSPLSPVIASRSLSPSGRGCSPLLPSPLQRARLRPSRTKS